MRLLRSLAGDTRAATVVEFALIAPALLMSLLGLFEFSHNIYTRTMLEGAIQKAARDSSIEGIAGRAATIDANVERAVKLVAPSAVVSFARKAYTNYSDVGRPEEFTDSNSDGNCNSNEPFVDVNGNGTWDQDRGRAGAGSARDAVLYEVTVSYTSYFPIGQFIGLDPHNTSKTRTVLRNQPYTTQTTATALGQCL